jgi:hypothetical protein
MPRSEFEPADPTTDRPQTYALDRADTGIGRLNNCYTQNNMAVFSIRNSLCN